MNRRNRPTPLRGSNGAAFGPDGRLYVAQFLAGQISAVDLAGGDVEVIVPPGGPVQAPDDLAFAPDGAMYIIDTVPGRVWRRALDGTLTLVTDRVRLPNGIAVAGERLFVNEMTRDGRLLELTAGGDPVVLTGGLALGNAMQLGPDGHLYYPHMITGEVHRISPDGGEPELVAADVHEPVAVRFDLDGTLLVLSRGVAGIVTRIDPGTGARTLITSGISGLDNAAFDAENRMYVTSYATGGVVELAPDGRTREIVPHGLTGPFGITVDLGGGVHAADHYRLTRTHGPDADVTTTALLHFVHDLAADGDLLHLTSQYGQVNTYDQTSATVRPRVRGLAEPRGVAVRADGALIVAEAGAGRVVAIGGDDSVTVLADGFGRPSGVAVHGGACYVSDEERGAVYRLDDGAPAVIVDGLDTPQGIAAGDGRLHVLEAGRHRLVSVDLEDGGRRTTTAVRAARTVPRELPALSAHGMPGVPRPFAGLAAAPDGTVYLAADGEGAVLHLTPERP